MAVETRPGQAVRRPFLRAGVRGVVQGGRSVIVDGGVHVKYCVRF